MGTANYAVYDATGRYKLGRYSTLARARWRITRNRWAGALIFDRGMRLVGRLQVH